MGALLVRRAKTDDGPGGDEGRLIGLVGSLDGSCDFVRVVTVDFDGVPVGRLQAGDLVGRVRQRYGAVDGDLVVVPEDDQLVELQVARQRNRFLADAFHQAAVTGQNVGVMVLQVGTELVAQLALGNRHADGVRDALAERAGRRFDAGCVAVFRMAGRLGADLAELLDVLDGHVLIAREVEQRVEQHGAVACGEDEAVAVGPERLLGVEFQVSREQHRGDVGSTHRQSGMARIGLLDGIHGKEADRIGHPVVFFARDHDLPVFCGVG